MGALIPSPPLGLPSAATPSLAQRALTCSFEPGAALAWSLAPEASSRGLPEGLGGSALALGALAAATQARGQMHLRCSGKGQQLQEGKGSLSFGLADPTGLTFWSRANAPPLPAKGTQGGQSGTPYLGALEYKVLPPWRSGCQDPEGCSPGKGAGALAWGFWVGGPRASLAVQEAAAQQVPCYLDAEPQEAG